jgi:hypothetical protein
MDDHEDGITPMLKIDVELEFEGPNDATLNKWAADTLRLLADRIEKDEIESGHHAVRDKVGKAVGEVYIDYFGTG